MGKHRKNRYKGKMRIHLKERINERKERYPHIHTVILRKGQRMKQNQGRKRKENQNRKQRRGIMDKKET